MKINVIKFFTILSIAIFVFSSCCKNNNEENSNRDYLDCVVLDDKEIKINFLCDNEFDTSQYCENIIIESPYRFTENERGWLPNYCGGINQRLYFENDDGQETYFTIVDHEHKISTLHRQGVVPCENDSNKVKTYCYYQERAQVKFHSELINEEFSFSLRIHFTELDDGFESKTYVGIDLAQSGTHYDIIEKESPPESENIQYFDELYLINEEFSKVYMLKKSIYGKQVDFYYNKEYGIVGFEYENIEWKIK